MNASPSSILIDIKQRADVLGGVVDGKYRNKFSIEGRDLDPHMIAALEYCKTPQDIREYFGWYVKHAWGDHAPTIEQILYNEFQLVEILFRTKEKICCNYEPRIWHGLNGFYDIKALRNQTLQQIRADIYNILR